MAAIKVLPLVGGWGMLYAGDPTYAESIGDRSKRALISVMDGVKRQPNRARVKEVEQVVRNAFQEELRFQVTNQFLSKYDMTLEQFRKSGKRQFGDDFEKINKPILEFSLGTSFIVCGVDDYDIPHILTLQSTVLIGTAQIPSGGNLTINDHLGHAAIGSGAQMALGALGARNLGGLSIEDLAYRVLDAKFVAETAQGVGKNTIIVLWRKGLDHPLFLPIDNPLRVAYNRAAASQAPEEARELIHETFKTAGLIDRELT
jgi:hypothetical protein